MINQVTDEVTRIRILTLHPEVRDDVITGCVQCQDAKVPIRIVQATRTFAEQQILWDQGRSKPGPVVTWAEPGMSFHNYALAFDFCLLRGRQISWNRNEDLDKDLLPDWMEVVRIFQALNFSWGGNFPKGKKDYPHMQKTFGLKIAQLLQRHRAKQYREDGFIILH